MSRAAVVSIADLKLHEDLEDRYDVSVSVSRLANPKRIPGPTFVSVAGPKRGHDVT